MLRIVKLTFQEDKLQDFLNFFDTINTKVAGFEGCNGMKLLQDIHQPHVVFTYSDWDDEAALNNYRYSDLFKGVWTTIKPWFDAKAEAWSVDTYFNGFPKN